MSPLPGGVRVHGAGARAVPGGALPRRGGGTRVAAHPHRGSMPAVQVLNPNQGCWEEFGGTGRGSANWFQKGQCLGLQSPNFLRQIYLASQSSFTAVPGRQHNCFPSALTLSPLSLCVCVCV
jgi:hypothetical protein